jgi:hypothetical protein
VDGESVLIIESSIFLHAKITTPLCKLLTKEVDFVFDQTCKDAHDELKRHVTAAPIIQPPN